MSEVIPLPIANRFAAWTRANLLSELKRLQHRQTFSVLSHRVRAKEDAEIEQIIAVLRTK